GLLDRRPAGCVDHHPAEDREEDDRRDDRDDDRPPALASGGRHGGSSGGPATRAAADRFAPDRIVHGSGPAASATGRAPAWPRSPGTWSRASRASRPRRSP